MATNLALDDKLIEAAKELGEHRTKKAAVMAALEDYVRRKRLERLLALEGRVEYYDDYDYKKVRRRDARQNEWQS